MKKRTNKRNYTPAIAFALLMVALFSTTACSKEAEPNEEVKTSTEKVAETKVEEVVEVPESTVEEPQQEAANYETAEEWVKSLEVEEPTVLIWNEGEKETIIIEENEEYQLKENDKVLLAKPVGQIDDFTCIPMEIFDGWESSKGFVELILNVQGKQEITFETSIGGQKYVNNVTLVGISGEGEANEVILAKEDIDINSTLPGEEWITSIGHDIAEPFIAIWNDADGSKKILENGEKYQLKEGDVFFLYLPSTMYYEMIEPVEALKQVKEIDNGIISYELDFDGEIVVNATIIDLMEMKNANLSCTLSR